MTPASDADLEVLALEKRLAELDDLTRGQRIGYSTLAANAIALLRSRRAPEPNPQLAAQAFAEGYNRANAERAPEAAMPNANMMSRVFLAAMAWSGSEPSTSVLYREIERARKLIAAPPSLKEQGAQETK